MIYIHNFFFLSFFAKYFTELLFRWLRAFCFLFSSLWVFFSIRKLHLVSDNRWKIPSVVNSICREYLNDRLCGYQHNFRNGRDTRYVARREKNRTRECNEYVIHVQSEQRAKTNWMNIGSLVARPACRQNRIYVLMGSDSRFERAHIEAIDACVIFRAPFAAQQTPICNKFLYSLCCRCRLFIRLLSLVFRLLLPRAKHMSWAKLFVFWK